VGQIQEAIDGQPIVLRKHAYETMEELRSAAEALLTKPLNDGSGLNAGPTFEFLS
jgi:hypothetical protein